VTTQSQLMIGEEAMATHLILRVVAFAETLRIIPQTDLPGGNLEMFDDAVRGLARLGVAQHINRTSGRDRSGQQMARVATAVLSAIEDSPIPQAEWGPLSELLGDELPALLGISTSSLTRYRSGERTTPDAVAARLHVLAQLVSDLAGSYNDFGIRRWFGRPRQALGGRAPNDILSGDWAPDDADVARVRALAESLLGAAVG